MEMVFQFTPLREGRPMAEWQYVLPVWNFNSRPSARGDKKSGAEFDYSKISIHAPPRGATRKAGGLESVYNISIHAPPRGATFPATNTNVRTRFQFTPLREGRRAEGQFAERTGYFNSRPSARGDVHLLMKYSIRYFISIHAPPRGATFARKSASAPQEFQFTPLREGRPNHSVSSSSSAGFQFTPLREGRQQFQQFRATFQGISIHAPPRGATIDIPEHDVKAGISIHAPPRGATGNLQNTQVDNSKFQFTPLREGRQEVGRGI